jgi:hypothetical protein
MIILATLLTIVTFPGVVLRVAVQLALCRSFRLAIFEVRFLQLKPPFGYVHYERSERFFEEACVTLVPFLFNSGLCLLFCAAAYLPLWELKIFDPLAYLFYWLGLSLGMHALPLRGDLRHFWRVTAAAAKRGNPLAMLTFPLLAAIRLVDLGRVLLADMAYGVALGVLLPLGVFRLLA